MGSDVLEDLRIMGSDVRINAISAEYMAVIGRTIREIERLRRVAGAVTDGETFGDIRMRSI